MAAALQRGDFPSPVGHEVSDSGLPGPLPNRQQEMSEGEALPVGMWVGACKMLEHTWYCPSLGACPLPQQSHTVYHVACFVYIKGRVFLIYSQIILVMTQICNKSHQCYLNVSMLCVIVLECLPGTSYIRAS